MQWKNYFIGRSNFDLNVLFYYLVIKAATLEPKSHSNHKEIHYIKRVEVFSAQRGWEHISGNKYNMENVLNFNSLLPLFSSFYSSFLFLSICIQFSVYLYFTDRMVYVMFSSGLGEMNNTHFLFLSKSPYSSGEIHKGRQ